MAESLIGKRLGAYQVLKELGRGGMGVVYQARDRGLRRLAAIKVLPSDFTHDRSLVDRFLREARACARLNHPNIVTVFGVGKLDETYFIAMEYVEGQSLDELIKSEAPLDVRKALEITRQAADALAAAHEEDIIHRDIKPQNIMIDRSGRVKVMDFGLASVQTESMTLTAAGTTLGTPQYMSPEQWKDSKVDARADIYSLGVTLFKMLTGKPPFEGQTTLALMRKVVDEPTPSVLDFSQEVPSEVADIVSEMIAKDPDDRYNYATDLRDDLDQYLGGAPPSTPVSVKPFSSPSAESQLKRLEKQSQAQRESQLAAATFVGTQADADAELASRRLPLYAGIAAVAILLAAAGAWFIMRDSATFADPLFPKSDFAWIGPGTFEMGSLSTEAGHDSDETVHTVTLTQGFWMGRFEVTQAQWETVMGTNPSFFKGGELPVEQVSWNEVQTFLDKLNAEYGSNFRLPTEAEWEYACRAGERSAYTFGNDPAMLGNYAWYGANSRSRSKRVGLKEANAWGIYDMHGNVLEWVADWADPYPNQDVTDPKGPAQGELRVARGGSWYVGPENCRSADRSASVPEDRGGDLGFRICQ